MTCLPLEMLVNKYNIYNFSIYEIHYKHIDSHRYAVTDVNIDYLQQHYDGLHYVKVTFGFPRQYRELQSKYNSHYFFYEIWRVSRGDAIMHDRARINIAEGWHFTITKIQSDYDYFFRIYTVTNEMSENKSALKFFIIKSAYNTYYENSFELHSEDTHFTPKMELKVHTNIAYYEYLLELILCNKLNFDYVDSYVVKIEREIGDERTGNSSYYRSPRVWEQYYYRVPYERGVEYAIIVTSVLKYRGVASEYSIRKFFVIT